MYTPEYPLKDPLPRISHHEELPPGAVVLAQLTDTTYREEIYLFVKYHEFLIILISYKFHGEYQINQYDYPLKVLSWFPWALEEFRKPSNQTTIHATGMTTKDIDVDGEMLCVQSTSEGYALMNRSRDRKGIKDPELFTPVDLSMLWNFLYPLGFLKLWKNLGEQYERGE